MGSARPLRRLGVRTQVSNKSAGQVQTAKVRNVCRIKRRMFVDPVALISKCITHQQLHNVQFPFYMHVLQGETVHYGREMVQNRALA